MEITSRGRRFPVCLEISCLLVKSNLYKMDWWVRMLEKVISGLSGIRKVDLNRSMLSWVLDWDY